MIWYEKIKTCCVQNYFENHYKVTDKIGKGAFAQVYKAVRNADMKTFAVKVFDSKVIHKNKNWEKHIVINLYIVSNNQRNLNFKID